MKVFSQRIGYTVSDLISDEAIWRTAPATLGLSKIVYPQKFKKFVKIPWTERSVGHNRSWMASLGSKVIKSATLHPFFQLAINPNLNTKN